MDKGVNYDVPFYTDPELVRLRKLRGTLTKAITASHEALEGLQAERDELDKAIARREKEIEPLR